MPNLLPQDNYDSNLSVALNDVDTVAYVDDLPTKTAGYLTIFEQDGRTFREKIKYTGTASSPNRLTGLVRGLSAVDTAGAYPDTPGTGLDHPSRVRIAMTDNVNYMGRVIAQLNGTEELGGVPQLPAARVIDSSRDVVDKEYTDAIAGAAGGITSLLVSKNGADPTLTINIQAGTFVGGASIVTYAGAAAQAVTASQTNYVQLEIDGTLVINTTSFVNGNIPLATVVCDGTTITSVTDKRPWLTMALTPNQVAALAGTSGTPAAGNPFVTDDDTTTTPTAGAIPRAGGDLKLDRGWIPEGASQYTAGENITANDALYLETRKYRYETGVDAVQEVFTATWEGQTFLVDATADTAYGAQIYCYKTGTASTNYTFALRATAAGLPTGANIASGTLTIANVSLSNQFDKGAWYTVTFGTPVALTAGTTYALIVYSASNTTGNCLVWGSDNSSPSFAGGSRVNSTNSGSSWAADTNKDYYFRIITTPFVKKAKADSLTTSFPFVGFAASTVTSGSSVYAYDKQSTVISGFTNLIPGRMYRLSQSTYGAIEILPATVGSSLGIVKYVGVAKSATELTMDAASLEDYLGSTVSTTTGSTTPTYAEVFEDTNSVVAYGRFNDGGGRPNIFYIPIKMTRGMSPMDTRGQFNSDTASYYAGFVLTWVGNHVVVTSASGGGSKDVALYQYR